MRIWKCDMCGTILENGEDVMVITCRDCADKTFYPNAYEVCRDCARNVNKFIKKEWQPELFTSLKMMYDYCRSQECDNCLLNAEQEKGDIRCMVGLPEDNWAKSYPALKKERDGK